MFGVGTSLVTGKPDAALDGVYKLAQADGRSVIKLSENVSKITLPDKKQVWRAFDDRGRFSGADAVALMDERDITLMHHPFVSHQSLALDRYELEPLLQPVMAQGKVLHDPPSLPQTAQYARERLGMLPAEYKRFENPHIYKVGISSRLKASRDRLIAQHKRSPKAVCNGADGV